MAKTAETTASKSSINGAKSRFKPGNPGRPKGAKDIRGLLDDALKAAGKLRAQLHEPCSCVLPETSLWLVAPTRLLTDTDEIYQDKLDSYKDVLWEKSCKTADQHFARRLYASDTVLIAFQKKRIPDLQHQIGNQAPTQVNISYGYQGKKVQIIESLPHEANGRDA